MQQYTDASLADERREEKQHRATKRQRDETQPKIRGNIGGIYAEILKVEERVRAGVVPADELDEPRRGLVSERRRKRNRKYARIRRSNGVDDTGPGLHYRLPDPPKCGKVHNGEAGSRLGIGSLMTTQIRCFLCGDSLTRTLSLSPVAPGRDRTTTTDSVSSTLTRTGLGMRHLHADDISSLDTAWISWCLSRIRGVLQTPESSKWGSEL